MPSTEYFGHIVTNLGPLTTTFTASSACATGTANLAVGDDQQSPPLLWRPECEFASVDPDCVPSASKYNALYSSYKAGDLDAQGAFPYHSPASICPSGWFTVGVAASRSGSVSTSGVFTTSARPFADIPDIGAVGLSPQAIYVEALEDGETLIWCCPSGHTADYNGNCLSSVAPWDVEKYGQFTTVCNYGYLEADLVTVTSYDSKIWDPPLLSLENPPDDYTTWRETLTPSATEHAWTVFHSQGAIALVHKPSDDGNDDGDGDSDGSNNNNNANGNGNDDGSDDDGDDDNGENEDAAPSVRALSLLPLTAIGFGLLAGMGVLAPW